MILKLGVGHFDERLLGSKSDPETRFLDHQPVIRAIADREDVTLPKTELLTRLYQRVAFRHRVDDRVTNLAAQLSAREYQSVCLDPVETDGTCNRFCKRQEAAGYEKTGRTARAHGLDQRLSARGNLDPFIKTTPQDPFVEAREKANSLPQCARKIQFALHRPLRDSGDLLLEASEIGEFVDAFLADDRRIHVSDQQPLPARLFRLNDDVHVLDSIKCPIGIPGAARKAKIRRIALVDPVEKGGLGIDLAKKAERPLNQPVIEPSLRYQRRDRHA